MSYPIGSIYQSTNSTNPSNIFGGIWSQIKDRFLLACGDNYANGSVGGEASHTLTTDEIPAHTHTRGTMNITGSFKVDPDAGWCRVQGDGAFYTDTTSKRSTGGATGSTDVDTVCHLNASHSWTGATSSVGGGQSHNNMPPYFAIYTWYRTA